MSVTHVALGDVADFLNGVAFRPEDWGGAGRRIIRIQNLTDPTKPYNRTTREVSPRMHVHAGDLLVSWSASLGVFTWEGPDVGLLNQHIFRVLPNERFVDKQYLRHSLVIALGEMRRHLHGATMQHVNRGEFLATRIPLPALKEQRRIAEVLDCAEAVSEKRRFVAAKAEKLSASIFYEMFGEPGSTPCRWPRMRLGDALEAIESGWSPNCLARPVEGQEWGVLKLGAITWCDFNPAQNKALPPGVQPRPQLEVRPGDILFARKNTAQLIAACALVRTSPPRLMLPDLMFRLRLRRGAGVEADYLHQLLIFPSKRREIQKLAGGSAGSMPNISKGRLATVEIEVPPADLQREFARRVAVVENLRTLHHNSLSTLNVLFDSLQSRAFRGQL